MTCKVPFIARILVKSIDKFNPEKKAELGRGTWALLHTIAARYPDKPSVNTQVLHFDFIHALSLIFPCPECAKHFQQTLQDDPPKVCECSRSFNSWTIRLFFPDGCVAFTTR